MIPLIIVGIVALFVFGFLVGRNNPNLTAVNKLIAAGKVIKDTAGNLIKKS